jgi:heptosyltransferase II
MRILIRGANWIGDAVMTIPAMRELRRLFPDAEITLYIRPWAEGIFRDAALVDKILAVGTKSSRFSATLAEGRLLKQHGFDMAVLFTNSFQSAAVVRFAGILKRFGYAREGRGVLLSDPIKPPAWRYERHQVYYYLNIVSQIERRLLGTETVDENEPVCTLAVSEERGGNARAFLENAGGDLSKRIVAFGAGSTNSMAKRWGSEKFAELGSKLSVELDANVLLLGAKNESDVSRQVIGLANADIIDLAGATDLAMATAILSECDLFVSNDMGLAHIAAAVGTKTIVIFGPTNDVTTRPFGSNAVVVRHEVECSPCMLRECPIDHRCMTRVSVDEVFKMAANILNARTQRP